MSDEGKPVDSGNEPITIRVRDQVSQMLRSKRSLYLHGLYRDGLCEASACIVCLRKSCLSTEKRMTELFNVVKEEGDWCDFVMLQAAEKSDSNWKQTTMLSTQWGSFSSRLIHCFLCLYALHQNSHTGRPEKKHFSRSRRRPKCRKCSIPTQAGRECSSLRSVSFWTENALNPIRHRKCWNWTIKIKLIACWSNRVDGNSQSFNVMVRCDSIFAAR